MILHPLQVEGFTFLFQNPGLMLLLGVFVVLFALLGRSGSRGPATGTPLIILALLGTLMIAIGLLGFLR